MEDENSILPPPKRTPWNKRKLIGAKQAEVSSIRAERTLLCPIASGASCQQRTHAPQQMPKTDARAGPPKELGSRGLCQSQEHDTEMLVGQS